jgi:hypothetical protein
MAIHHHAAGTSPSRREIDIAVGILMALHGHSEREAFDELVATVQRTGQGIASVSRALIALVRAPEGAYPIEALQIWGQLSRRRAGGSPARMLGQCR